MVSLNTSISEIPHIKGVYTARLKKLGIETFGDLLHHIPSRYDNFSLIAKIETLQPGETVTIQGNVLTLTNTYTRRRLTIQKAKISDGTGEIDVTWYNQPFLTKILLPQTSVSLAGSVTLYQDKIFLESPQYEILRYPGAKPIHTGRLVPIYPETEGVSSKWLRSRIDYILRYLTPDIPEFFPEDILRKFSLIGEKEAIEQIHFPKSYQEEEEARRRLSFDEVFILQYRAQQKRKEWKMQKTAIRVYPEKQKGKIESFVHALPFTLTQAQQKTISEIFSDLTSSTPMNRLLAGDVGSGKTVVASVAMYLMYLSGYQSVLMAPTEILANQHFQTLSSLFAPYKLRIGLVTQKEKKGKLSDDILIGTHALLSPKVKFPKLGFVVIDEQQRFGVTQRATLRSKGKNPHLLSMTATPIPRTIALTLFSDLDISTLDELPVGRKIVKTWVVPAVKREKAYTWIARQKAFIICPFITESESLQTVKAATVEYERLKRDIFPHLALGLLHGRMKSEEKNKVLTDFKNGTYDILVATPVVEVGIDIPQATVILIEGAERFGLAQLHQLRGRVGRSSQQSYCLLFSEATNEKALKRLSLLATTSSGPKLAEYDLKLRGPGDLYGTSQSGIFHLKIATYADPSLFKNAKEAALFLLHKDPHLSQFPLLREKVQNYTMKESTPD